MQTMEIEAFARQLFEARGAKAIAEAAQNAAAYEAAGDTQLAEIWRRIEAALLLLRGARQS